MLDKKRRLLLWTLVSFSVIAGSGVAYSTATRMTSTTTQERNRPEIMFRDFNVDVLVDGRPLEEYAARGRTYVEALEGREYELRVHNPYSYRVAVALSVDGLNTIDARHTTAWDASKWVIEPYGTIEISGWQVSSSRARHFYFTTERDSYGAKLGQTANLGVIAAVFFRERQPIVRITPPPTPRPYERGGDKDDGRGVDAPARSEQSQARAKSLPSVDDESAATGIGRSVGHDVRWVNMQLDSRPMSEMTIRYEFYQGLTRLGIYPRPYPRPVPMGRREAARGFEDRRYSPEPE
jgi:hypothetical protein